MKTRMYLVVSIKEVMQIGAPRSTSLSQLKRKLNYKSLHEKIIQSLIYLESRIALRIRLTPKFIRTTQQLCRKKRY